jgi:hypothetical protein
MKESSEKSQGSQLEELSIKDFAGRELASWLTTSDEELVESQAGYIVAGSITGTLPRRYSAQAKAAHNKFGIAHQHDAVLDLLELQQPATEGHVPNEEIGVTEYDVKNARNGEDALSELTINYVRDNPQLVKELLQNMPESTDKDFVLRNVAVLKELEDKLARAEYDKKQLVAAGMQRARSVVAAKRLRTAGLSAEPVAPIGGADEMDSPFRTSNASAAFIAQQVNWHGTRGGGSPSNASQVNTSRN